MRCRMRSWFRRARAKRVVSNLADMEERPLVVRHAVGQLKCPIRRHGGVLLVRLRNEDAVSFFEASHLSAYL